MRKVDSPKKQAKSESVEKKKYRKKQNNEE